jgi:hypothetical protein
VPGGSGGGIPGNGGWTGLAFGRFFSGRGLATQIGLHQRLPRRPLHRMPPRALPPGAGRARRQVLHPGRAERRSPAALVVARELEVKALASHADSDVADAGPGVEPGTERPKGDALGSPAKPTAAHKSRPRWSSTLYSMTSSARARIDGGIVRPSARAVLRLMTSRYCEACSTGRSPGLAPFRILSM